MWFLASTRRNPAVDTVSHSCACVQAGLLYYAQRITEAFTESQVLDCVLTVPAWFGQSHRQALLDAADLAGINVVSLINSHAAAALQHGIARDFANKTEQFILYDMGAGSTEASLIK